MRTKVSNASQHFEKHMSADPHGAGNATWGLLPYSMWPSPLPRVAQPGSGNAATVRGFYAALEVGDIERVVEILGPDVRWTEAPGTPYAAAGDTHVGGRDVAQCVLTPFATDVVGLNLVTHELLTYGDTIIALGTSRRPSAEQTAPTSSTRCPPQRNTPMATLLHVSASPRGATSGSLALAEAFQDSYRAANPDVILDHLDLFDGALPAFGRLAAEAKMACSAADSPPPSRQASGTPPERSSTGLPPPTRTCSRCRCGTRACPTSSSSGST